MLKKYLFFLLAAAWATCAVAQDVPPHAQPGKCYAKCFVPDQYEIYTEHLMVKGPDVNTVAVPAEFTAKTGYVVVKEESKRIVITPAEYETTEAYVMIKSESRRLPGNKAVEYETARENVMVKPETRRFIEVPAEYETVTESYVEQEASTRVEILLPQFVTETERVEIRPAALKWVKRKAAADCISANPDDCMTMCLVEVPAEYQTVTKRVNKGCDGSGRPNAGCVRTVQIPAKMATRSVKKVKKPASVREEIIPAEYKTVTVRLAKLPADAPGEKVPAEYITLKKQLLKKPASYREEIVPAEYKAVPVQVLKTPATTREEPVPAEYLTITKRRLVKQGGYSEWQEVVCPEKMESVAATTATAAPKVSIRQVQDALRKAGYNPGVSDNKLGGRTSIALEKYQKDKGLPTGGINDATLKALGLLR